MDRLENNCRKVWTSLQGLIHLNGLISDDTLMVHAAQLCAYAGNFVRVLEALYWYKCSVCLPNYKVFVRQ